MFFSLLAAREENIIIRKNGAITRLIIGMHAQTRVAKKSKTKPNIPGTAEAFRLSLPRKKKALWFTPARSAAEKDR